MQMTERKYPAVVRLPDYTAPHGQPGYDGQPQDRRPPRDIQSRDRLTGKIVRELPLGEENVNSTRIRAMHVGKRLTDRQYYAASRYADDWQLSQAQVIATAGVLPGSGFARSTLPDARLDAMTRWGAARAHLGARYWQIVESVVLGNVLLEVVANIMKIDKRKAGERFECGLERLGDFYGLPEETA